MGQPDKSVSMNSYIKVNNETIQDFRVLANNLIETTRGEMGCLFYGFTYSDSEACCLEGYKDAESLVAHLDNIEDLLQRLYMLSEHIRLEVHGPQEAIDKLLGWPSLNKLNPKFYVLETGFRN